MSKQKITIKRRDKASDVNLADNKQEAPDAAQHKDSPSEDARQSKALTETRVDAPHVLNPKPTASRSTESQTVATASVEQKSVDSEETAVKEPPREESNATESDAEESSTEERLRIQAAQLGERLRLRQEDLDRRESQLNARVAELENGARAARLWFTESREEFDRREHELAEKTQQMQRCLIRLARAEESSVRRQAKLDAQAERLDKDTASLSESRKRFEEEQQQRREQTEKFAAREQQRIDTRRQASLVLVRQALAGLERRRLKVESHAQRLMEKAVRPGRELLAREEAVREASEEFQRRRQQIFETEQSLAAEECEVRGLRRKLLAQREQLERLEQKRRQEAADERDALQVELESKRKQLDRRGEDLDRAQTALRHLRAELSTMHRETLELRLAAEELWMQLSGTIPPAALTQSLSRIRGSLAETYRAENAELARRKLELRAIGAELAEDHKRLQQQKDELDAWSVRRERQIEQQAQRLVAREQELHDQETNFEEKAHGWATARLEYQQEIRRLRDQLDEAGESGKNRAGMFVMLPPYASS